MYRPLHSRTQVEVTASPTHDARAGQQAEGVDRRALRLRNCRRVATTILTRRLEKNCPFFGNSFPFSFHGTFSLPEGVLGRVDPQRLDLNFAVAGFGNRLGVAFVDGVQ